MGRKAVVAARGNAGLALEKSEYTYQRQELGGQRALTSPSMPRVIHSPSNLSAPAAREAYDPHPAMSAPGVARASRADYFHGYSQQVPNNSHGLSASAEHVHASPQSYLPSGPAVAGSRASPPPRQEPRAWLGYSRAGNGAIQLQ